jgi:hypothetical protein
MEEETFKPEDSLVKALRKTPAKAIEILAANRKYGSALAMFVRHDKNPASQEAIMKMFVGIASMPTTADRAEVTNFLAAILYYLDAEAKGCLLNNCLDTLPKSLSGPDTDENTCKTILLLMGLFSGTTRGEVMLHDRVHWCKHLSTVMARLVVGLVVPIVFDEKTVYHELPSVEGKPSNESPPEPPAKRVKTEK